MTHMPSFPAAGRTIVRAQGNRVWDDTGREFLCATSGLWNVNCGFGHPRIIDAIAEQLQRLSYGTLFRYANLPSLELAERLLDLAPAAMARVFYTCSGGGAIDTAMKLVRRWQRLAGRPERRLVIGLRGSYHGTMYGSSALTGDDLEQEEYSIDRRWVRHAAPNSGEELAEVLDREGQHVAAVFVEPVLGSGCIPLTPDYVASLGKLRQRHDFLLVVDEVATGFGRTGNMFACETWPISPDLLVLSKGITSGYLPLAAVLVSARVARDFDRAGVVFAHGETQSGNPAACAAAMATLEVIRDEDLVANARAVGELLGQRLDALTVHPRVAGHRGLGLMRSLLLQRSPGTPMGEAEMMLAVEAVRDEGAIVHPNPSGLGLLPPLTFTTDDVDELVGCLSRTLERL